MNANTSKAVQRHGLSLLAAFPSITEKDPVVLCKKLRRIEAVLHKAGEAWCNGDIDENQWLNAKLTAWGKLQALGFDGTHLHFNADPRGYALKLDADWTREYNLSLVEDGVLKEGALLIYRDTAGFGILAPDLSTK